MTLPTQEQIKVLQALALLKQKGKISDQLPFNEQYDAAAAMLQAANTPQQATGEQKLFLVATPEGVKVAADTEQNAAAAKKEAANVVIPETPNSTSALNTTLNGGFIAHQVVKNNGFGWGNLLRLKGPANPSQFLAVNEFAGVARTGFLARAGGFLTRGTGPVGGVIAAAEDLYHGGVALYEGRYDDAGKSGIKATTTGLGTWGMAAAGAAWGTALIPIPGVGTVVGGIVGGIVGWFTGKKTGEVIADATIGETKSEATAKEQTRLAELAKQGPVEMHPALAQILTDPLTQAHAQKMVAQQNVGMNGNGNVNGVVKPNVGTQANPNMGITG